MFTETKDFDDFRSDDFEGFYEVLTLSSDGVFLAAGSHLEVVVANIQTGVSFFNGIDSIYPLNTSLQERY